MYSEVRKLTNDMTFFEVRMWTDYKELQKDLTGQSKKGNNIKMPSIAQ